MNRKNRLLTGLLLLLAAVVLSAVLYRLAAATVSPRYPILLAKSALREGQVVTEADLVSGTTSDKQLATLGYSDPAAVLGLVAVLPIAEGRYLLRGDLQENILQRTPYNSLEPGTMLLSIGFSSLPEAVSGQLRAGDVIRFFTLDEAGAGLTPPALQCVRVAAVYDSGGNELDASGRPLGDESKGEVARAAPASAALIVTQEQALQIITASLSAGFRCALLSRDDPGYAETLLDLQARANSARGGGTQP